MTAVGQRRRRSAPRRAWDSFTDMLFAGGTAAQLGKFAFFFYIVPNMLFCALLPWMAALREVF